MFNANLMNIKQVRHPVLGTSAVIQLSPITLQFHAKVGEQTFTSTDSKQVENWIIQALWENADVRWQPIMVIESARVAKNKNWNALAGYSAKRYWVGQKSDGTWVRTDWNNVGNNGQAIDAHKLSSWLWKRDDRTELRLPWVIKFGGDPEPSTFIRQYDEGVWNAMNAIVLGLNSMHYALVEAFSQENAHHGLKAVSDRLVS